jgi:FMN phosphatase YigB (HAD superfamily)
MSLTAPVVFLVDVDNTLLDNDRILEDVKEHFARICGLECRDRYWAIVMRLFDELGYRDYIEALQRYRVQHPYDSRLLSIGAFLIDYPFADRLYPGALDTLRQLSSWGTTAVLSDGDVVFQPRKVERSGIWQAVGGNVMIYIHKEHELEDIARRFPAQHYILVDDKLRILSAVKQIWGSRVTTVFPRTGSYANDPQVLASNPPPDVAVESFSELAGPTLDKILKRSLT